MVERQKKVLVKNYGCSTNLADGEVLQGCLTNAGFDVVNETTRADVLIHNTCAVKSPTENRMINELKKSAKLKKKLIVTGCLPLINLKRLKNEIQFDGVLGPAPSYKIVEAVQKVLGGEKVQWLDGYTEFKPRLDLPKKAVNPAIDIIPVAYGCLGSCNYCCVVFARGHLRSCEVKDVIQRIECDLRVGIKEIWLTGQDVACYGRDIKINLLNLLQEVGSINGDFFVRVGMMTPNYVLDMLDELVKAFRNDHIFKFLHLPIQSGDDEVLEKMNRFYSVNDFQRIIAAFREAIPNITISTDVICGFPTESEEAFKRTLRLIEKVKPDIVNMSKFYPRPRTSAEKMKTIVSVQNVVERSKRLAKLVRVISAEKNRSWMDWTGKILIDERGKQSNSWIGRNIAYKPIVIRSKDKKLFGKSVNVRVVETFQTYLEAVII